MNTNADTDTSGGNGADSGAGAQAGTPGAASTTKTRTGATSGGMNAATRGGEGAPTRSGVKETLISLTIALAMAFIAKMYVIEAYRIPTGSMAPTLLGAHMQFRGPATGYAWPVDPWWYAGASPTTQMPLPQQGGVLRDSSGRSVDMRPPAVTDPMTAVADLPSYRAKEASPTPEPKELRAGDRILVQKYLFEVRPPRRWDVVVFKNPSDANVNYIKRLVGEPGEALWLVDGDVFTLPGADEFGQDDVESGSLAMRDGWGVQRKPMELQDGLWRELFSSEYTPLTDAGSVGWRFDPPWEPTSGEWAIDGRASYALTSESGSLTWDTERWPITDFLPYNEVRVGSANSSVAPAASRRFPVGDLRVRFGVKPERDGATVRATISVRGYDFAAVIGGDTVEVMRRRSASTDELGNAAAAGEWQVMASEPWSGLSAGGVTDVAFWHADQALSVVIDGRAVIRQAAYEMSPAERIEAVTRNPLPEFMESQGGSLRNDLDDQRAYLPGGVPTVSVSVEGSPAELFRVGLDKDLYYRPYMSNGPAFGGHPENIALLRDAEYFVLGDNSGASLDSRGWREDRLDPWVTQRVREWTGDPEVRVGVVHRKLMLGKAFFVYWPATFRPFGLYVPDVGRMRMIY